MNSKLSRTLLEYFAFDITWNVLFEFAFCQILLLKTSYKLIEKFLASHLYLTTSFNLEFSQEEN